MKIKRLISAILLIAVLIPGAAAYAAAGYSDVPESSWAVDVIKSAGSYGLLEGQGGGKFGYGASVKRSEFVTALCRMFGWELVTPAGTAFSDVSATAWYAAYVETALAHDVMDAGGRFRPDDAATREEMAVMLVRALGYEPLAEKAEKLGFSPFTDVTDNAGYIAVAYDIGMVNGLGDGTFAPKATAKREEMAAMLVRIYEKLIGKTEWLHGFYAFSSWSQRSVTREMDAVSAGWSRLTLGSDGPVLNTTSSGGNEWYVPASYESLISYLDEGDTPLHLDVYMDNSDGEAEKILTSADYRTKAVAAIVDELEREYSAVGKTPYSGVTIDFEGLSGSEQKAGFTAFLTELDAALESSGKTLYVTVQPVAEGGYYDGYDYRAIGNLADKVILMAHDYNATDLTGFEGSSYYKTTALTPLADVYYSLRAITDPDTGVADKDKIAIAISFSSLAWSTEDGLLKSASPSYPSVSTIYKRLKQSDTVIGWSETYKNPYAQYKTEDGEEIFLWYEDERSISEKLTLARLFGITGVSVWRIGTIPDYDDAGIYYNVWEALKG